MQNLVTAAFLVVAVVAQLTLIPFFSIADATPDIVLISIILISLRRGRTSGIAFAFFAGLAYDSVSSGLLGLSSLSCALAAFVAGAAAARPGNRPGVAIGLSLLALFVHDVVYFEFLRFGTSLGFWTTLATVVAPATAYNLTFWYLIRLSGIDKLLRPRIH